MACVFGDPIDDDDAKRIDRAQEALSLKNAKGKDVKARNYVEILKKEWDEYLEEKGKAFADRVCFLILVYNATGVALRHFKSKDYGGHLGHGPYPSRIANGQWGAFLHVQDSSTKSGSNGAVVYRDNADENERGWLMVWNNPGADKLAEINIYGEVSAIATYESDDVWTNVKAAYNSGKSLVCHCNQANGGVFDGSTGRGLAPIYEVVLSFDGTT